MNCHLHIVCPHVPWPADSGGSIDMLYKIEALYQQGVKIHLHYFSSENEGNPNELNRFCASIHLYKKKTGSRGFSFRMPAIVSSRINDELVTNLQKDDYPILMEGIHCTGILPQFDLSRRKVMVRMHNDDCRHFQCLAKTSSHILKKIMLYHESRLLKRYEKKLPGELSYACITEKETAHFSRELKLSNSFFLPAFTPYQEVNSEEGIGTFCLYHGNLSTPENEKAAAWLLTKVFPSLKVPLIIAGKNPSQRLDNLAHLCRHTCLVANPTATEMNDLIQKAQINILPSFGTTGSKIKLLNALYNGRHCLVNDDMVNDSVLKETCHIANHPDAFKSIILQLYHQPFEAYEIALRKRLLYPASNQQSLQLLVGRLFE